MPLSPVINDYVYSYPNTQSLTGDATSARTDAFDILAKLGQLGEDWSFVSTDNNAIPALKDGSTSFYEHATKIATNAASYMNSIMTGLTSEDDSTGNWPYTAALVAAIAPPGHVIQTNSTPPVQFISFGALWNLWASGEYFNGSSTDPSTTWNEGAGDSLSIQVAAPYNFPAFSNNTSSEFQNFLVQAVYDFRNLWSRQIQPAAKSLIDESTNKAQTILFMPGKVEARPAIQDFLVTNYAMAGESLLQKDLGETADAMARAETLLTALNKIEEVIALNIPNITKDLTFSGTADISNAKVQLSGASAKFKAGYSAIQSLLNSGRISKAYQPQIQSVLQAPHALSAYNKLVAGSNIPATSYLLLWWQGNKASEVNNTAITAFENVNDTLKQELKKAILIYQEFVKSASSVMSKLNQIVKASAQQIKGR